MNEEWGPWIEHDGKGQPIPDGMDCQAFFYDLDDGCEYGVFEFRVGVPTDLCPFYTQGTSEDWQWIDAECEAWIVRYRYRKPKGLTILERIASQPQERIEA